MNDHRGKYTVVRASWKRTVVASHAMEFDLPDPAKC
jgi:hypothetical protein